MNLYEMIFTNRGTSFNYEIVSRETRLNIQGILKCVDICSAPAGSYIAYIRSLNCSVPNNIKMVISSEHLYEADKIKTGFLREDIHDQVCGHDLTVNIIDPTSDYSTDVEFFVLIILAMFVIRLFVSYMLKCIRVMRTRTNTKGYTASMTCETCTICLDDFELKEISNENEHSYELQLPEDIYERLKIKLLCKKTI